MNDYVPSERKQGVVMNFSSMPPEVLKQMIQDLKLSMSLADLSFCQHYFANTEKRVPTLEEIYFVDAIVRSRLGHADRYRIARTNRGGGALIATYEDFLQKAAVFQRKIPLLQNEAAEIAAKYLERIGAGRDLSRIPRPTGVSPKRARAPFPRETAFSLLLPTEENDGYDESVQRFLADSSVQYRVRGVLPIGEGGIAPTLSHVTNGVFADLSRLSSDETVPPSLSCLCEDFHGRQIVAVARADAEWLADEADRFALRAVYFAKATTSKKFTLAREHNPYLNMDIGFMRAVENGTQDGDFYLPENDAENALFYRAMYDAISTVWQSTAARHARRDVSLRVNYRFPSKKVSPDALGQNFSLILGVYRAMIELCIAGVSHVEFEEALEAPFCQITSFAPLRTLPETFTQAGQFVYAVPLEETPDGLPLFDRCRIVTDSLTKCSREKKITATAKLSSTVAETLSAMENGCFCQTECEESLLHAPMHGIVLESSAELPFLRIGTVAGTQVKAEETVSFGISEEPIPQKSSHWQEETL